MLVGSAELLPSMAATLEEILSTLSHRKEWLAFNSPRMDSSRDASCDASDSGEFFFWAHFDLENFSHFVNLPFLFVLRNGKLV